MGKERRERGNEEGVGKEGEKMREERGGMTKEGERREVGGRKGEKREGVRGRSGKGGR